MDSVKSLQLQGIDNGALYQFAASGPGTGRIAIVEGDHGYEEPGLAPPAAEAARQRNIAAVAALAAAFVSDMAGERARGKP